MKNWLKKVLSLLIAIALLISAGTLAFADENAEPIESAAAEEAAAQQAAEEAAAAQKAAEEAAAVQKAAEEAAAAQKAAEEAAAAQKAAEEAAAAQKAAEEAAAQQAAEEMDPIPSYNNNEETPAENQQESSEQEEDDEEEAYDPDDPTIICIDDDDHGHSDPETVKELGLQVTDEMKFPNAVRLNLNEKASGSVDPENAAEYIFTSAYNMAAVLSLNASAEDVSVMINDSAAEFTKAEGDENEAGLKAAEMVLPEGTYHIVLTSSSPATYTFSIADAYKADNRTEETGKEEADETTDDVNNAADNTDGNKQEGSEMEGTETGNSENNTDEGTTENEIPVLTGWISVNAESYEIGDTITLKAESETELGDMVLWQTKVRNEEGEDAWQNLSYGATIDVELTEDNINATYRFKMEYDNFSDELTLNAKSDEETNTEETEETAETEQPEETEETEETETTEETEEAEETEDEKMTALGCIKVIVTAEEGADLYAEADKESEVTGHLDAETEIWVTLNEDQTWGRLYSEDEEAVAQFISMEDAEIVIAEEETEETEETEEPEEAEETEEEKMAALGFIKVTVTAEEGADLYAEADRESEVTGHLDAETEIWVTLNEEETWGQLYSEDEEAAAQFICMEDVMTKEAIEEAQMNEKGFYKVQILNQNGTDVYDGTGEEANVISHLEYESVIWIKDLEDAEGWAELYTETAEAEETEETVLSFVKLEEISRLMPSDEEMLEAGYIKVYVAMDIGANIYEGFAEYEGEEAVGHLEAGTELWVKLVEGANRALIFDLDEEAPARYINLVDIIAILKPDGIESLPTRMVTVTSSIDGREKVYFGSGVEMKAAIENFSEDDNYSIQWKYSPDKGENFYDIEEENELVYSYVLDRDNINYIWRIVIMLHPKEIEEEETI